MIENYLGKYIGEEDVVSDEKIKLNLEELYSKLAKDIESVNYNAYEDKFSLDDDFVLLRQRTEDVMAEEDFDEEGNLAELVLGENAQFHIDKHMSSLKLIGPPRRVQIPRTNSGERPKEKGNAFIEASSVLDRGSRPAAVGSSGSSGRDFSGRPNRKDSGTFGSPGISLREGRRSSEASIDWSGNDGDGKSRQERWSEELKEMKEKSKKIVADIFKRSNLLLNPDLDRPLSLQERFNSGDSIYVPRGNPDNTTLMDKLVQYANENLSPGVTPIRPIEKIEENETKTPPEELLPTSEESLKLDMESGVMDPFRRLKLFRPDGKVGKTYRMIPPRSRRNKFVEMMSDSEDDASDDSNDPGEAWFQLRRDTNARNK